MTLHLKVLKTEAQPILVKLKKESVIDHDYQIQRDETHIFIPVLLKDDLSFPEEWSTVDIPPKESKSKPRPRTSGGAFDLIGNIAITKIRNNVRAEQLASDLLLSHPSIKTVFLDNGITGDYRLRDLELLQGELNYKAHYRENGIIFELDVSKVYFSPRLATERMFVAKDSREGEYIIDMFAGIGAFSLNIAKTNEVRITAIDSNPDAVSYMIKCLELNTLKGTIEPICGRAEEVVPDLPIADRIIMNLPHESSHYLELASKKIRKDGVIHYYEILDIKGLEQRMEDFKALGFEITKKREVHGYSASLSMYSLTAVYKGA